MHERGSALATKERSGLWEGHRRRHQDVGDVTPDAQAERRRRAAKYAIAAPNRASVPGSGAEGGGLVLVLPTDERPSNNLPACGQSVAVQTFIRRKGRLPASVTRRRRNFRAVVRRHRGIGGLPETFKNSTLSRIAHNGR